MHWLALIKVLSMGYAAGFIGMSIAAALWNPVRPRTAPAQRADLCFAAFTCGFALTVFLTLFIWWGVINHHIRMTTNYFHHLMYGGWGAAIAATGIAVLLISLALAWAGYRRTKAGRGGEVEAVTEAGVKVLKTPWIATAGLVGLRPSQIWVNPAYWESLDAGQRALAIQHELVHHRRGDNLRKLLLQFVAALFGASPQIRRLPRQYELDCELATDDRCRRLASEQSYAALVAHGALFALEGPAGVVASGMSQPDLAERLKVLRDPPRRSSPWLVNAVFILLAASCIAPAAALLSTSISRCLVACYLGY